MRWPVVLLAAGLAALPVAARAQLLQQYYPVGIPGYESWFSDAVQDRPHTEYDPLGVRVGNFVVRPELSESFGYDSNIFTSPAAVGSALATTHGAVSAGSDWSRHALNADISFDQRQYLQDPHASYLDWTGGFGGVIDIGRDRVTLAYAHVTVTSGATQIGTLTVGQPVTTTFDSAHASYETTFGRLSLEPALEAARYRFTAGPEGGASEAANDRNAVTGSLTAGYELAPGDNLVLVARGTSAAYPNKTPGVATPDYTDVSVVGGIDYRSGLLFRYRATVGYEQRNYVNSQLSGTAAPVTEFDVIWTPTQLTTVTGQVARNLQNAIAAIGSQSFTYTNARLQVDHEYLRNLLLQGFGQFENAAYQMHGETQHVISAGASVTWLLNRKLSVIGRYTFSQSSDNVNFGLNETSSLAELTLDFHL